jgi:hypothetical protein
MIESYDLVDKWLYDTLSADSALGALVGSRIGSELSTAQWVGPYVTWEARSTRTIRSISGEILDTDSLFAVVAVTQSSSYASAAVIASRVRALIDARNVTVAGGSLTCFMEREDRAAESVEGVPYRYLGGVYRIRAVSI